MGNCRSSDSTQVATAKLILQDGKLLQFSSPVKVSHVLKEYPTCFICNSDEMDFDDVVTAVEENQFLQPGQLYFALPLTRLRLPLQPQEMAALAVKASSALMKTASADNFGNRKKQILFSGEFESRRVTPVVATAGGGGGTVRRSRRGRTVVGGGGGRFMALLSAIPE